MSEKKVILFDLDDCLAQFSVGVVGAFTDEDKARLPHVVDSESLLGTIFGGGPLAEVADEVLNRIFKTEKHFFANLLPMEGATSGPHDNILRFFLDRGYDVRICSSPSTENKTCASDKTEWVKRHFGDEFARRLILTKDKTLVRGDLLIDDNHCVKGIYTPEWQHVRFIGHAPTACNAHTHQIRSSSTSSSAGSFGSTPLLTFDEAINGWQDREAALRVVRRLLGEE